MHVPRHWTPHEQRLGLLFGVGGYREWVGLTRIERTGLLVGERPVVDVGRLTEDYRIAPLLNLHVVEPSIDHLPSTVYERE